MSHSKKEKRALRLAIIISAGFIAQWIMILDMKRNYGTQYISMFDWYILNYSAAEYVCVLSSCCPVSVCANSSETFSSQEKK